MAIVMAVEWKRKPNSVVSKGVLVSNGFLSVDDAAFNIARTFYET